MALANGTRLETQMVIRDTLDSLRAGDLVLCINAAYAKPELKNDSYYIVNKVTNYTIHIDGNEGGWAKERFTLNDYCIKHNNPKTLEQVKMEKKQGAIKNDTGKQPISFIPSEYILGTAEVFKFGAKKYAAHNFRKGFAHSRPLDAVMRHCLAILAGEEIDAESGLPHVYHASCSLAMYDYMRLHYPELNDIYEIIEKTKSQLKENTCQLKEEQDLQLPLPLECPPQPTVPSMVPLKYQACENWFKDSKPSSK